MESILTTNLPLKEGMGVVQKPGWVAQQYEEAKEKATA